MGGKRVVFRNYGGPEVLAVEPFEVARPRANEVCVEVAFSGVNFGDCTARRGFYSAAPPPPLCVGFEASGTVTEVGSGVSRVRPGDRVMCVTRFGGYASHLVLDERYVLTIPDSMSLEHAAAIPAVYLTAWHSIHEVARMRAGESILIQAVAGGVGLAALQLSKHLGLVTYGTASSPKKLEIAKGFGLDHAIDYAAHDFEAEVMRLTNGEGVDVVLDSLGGEALKKAVRCLSLGGKAITIGAAQVAPERKNLLGYLKAGVELAKGGAFWPLDLIQYNRGVLGVQVLHWFGRVEHMHRALSSVVELYEEGAVRPVIDSTFPYAKAGEAHAKLESRGTVGKVLLSPN